MSGKGNSRDDSGMKGAAAKPASGRSTKTNPNVVKGIVLGVLLLVLLLLVSWQCGLFSGSTPKAPAIVALPNPSPTPSPSAMPPAIQSPPSQPPELPVLAAPTSDAQMKQEEPEKQQNLPLPENVTTWKREDYFRARAENDPKLVQAVAYLGKNGRGSETVARGLTSLLTPLPVKSSTASGLQPSPVPPVMPGLPPGPPLGPPMGLNVPPPVLSSDPAISPATGASPRQGDPAELAKLVEAIVEALGDNDSETARRSLERILTNTLPTDDDKTAVEAALKTLIAHPSAENNRLLLWALLGPDVLRMEDRQGMLPGKELQAKTLELIKGLASDELRVDLSEALADRVLWLGVADSLRAFLLTPDPLNCGAQIVLYKNAATSKEIKARLEQQFIGYSGATLTRLLGLSGEAQAGGNGLNVGLGGFNVGPGGFNVPPGGFNSPPGGFNVGPNIPFGGSDRTTGTLKKADVDFVPQIVDRLWSGEFLASLESQVSKMRSLEKQPQLMLLASSIPQDSTRAVLTKLFRNHWSDGPNAFEAAGWPDKVTTDPGLLVLVKMIPRKDVEMPNRMSAGVTPRAARSVPARNGAAETTNPTQKKEQAKQDWMGVSSKLVVTWCKLFRAAALAKAKAAAESGAPDVNNSPTLPPDFTLSNGAKVVGVYDLRWPDNAPAELSGRKPSLLEIHYVCFEETGKSKKLQGFYTQQARLAQIRLDARTIDKAIWLDGGSRLSSTAGCRRSVDVLLTQSDGHASPTGDVAKDDTEVDFTVEVLTIEIKDPVVRE